MTLRTFFNIVELRTKVVSMGTFLSATAFAYAMTGQFSLLSFLLMAIAVLCVDMGTTAFNSYFDYRNGTDRTEKNQEADKVLVHQGVEPGTALIVALSLFAVDAVFGLCLAWRTSWLLLVAGGGSMLVGFFYTGGPRPISRTPFGELFAGGFLGSVLFLVSFYIQALYVDWTTVAVSATFFLLVGMILTVNNSCDRIRDAETGRKTLSILIGRHWAARLPMIEFFLAYAISVWLWRASLYPPGAFAGIIASLLPCLLLLGSVERSGFSAGTKSRAMRRVSLLYGLFCLFFIVGTLAAVLSGKVSN